MNTIYTSLSGEPQNHLRPLLSQDALSIAVWNDEIHRTQRDVIELFNKAIAKLEADVRVTK